MERDERGKVTTNVTMMMRFGGHVSIGTTGYRNTPIGGTRTIWEIYLSLWDQLSCDVMLCIAIWWWCATCNEKCARKSLEPFSLWKNFEMRKLVEPYDLTDSYFVLVQGWWFCSCYLNESTEEYIITIICSVWLNLSNYLWNSDIPLSDKQMLVYFVRATTTQQASWTFHGPHIEKDQNSEILNGWSKDVFFRT